MIKFFFVVAQLSIVIATAYAQETMKLWPNGVPNAIECDTYAEEIFSIGNGKQRIKQVTDPTITIYTPAANISKHKAIVICPGGGYIRLSLEEEGHEIARKLSDIGITGIVLKYRLPSDKIMENKAIGPLQDVQQAIRVVRHNANKLDINQVGVMGFSAGGHLASSALTLSSYPTYDTMGDTTSACPDFGILLYPVISSDSTMWHKISFDMLTDLRPELIELFSTDKQVHCGTPPTFIVHCSDDRSVSYKNSLAFVEQMIKHKNIVEYHIFSKGGHGFGLGNNKQNSQWFELMMHWIDNL